MGWLIDSSAFVAAERRRFDLASWLERNPDEVFAISAITASELLHGVHRAPPGPVQASRHAFVEAVLDQYPIFAFDAEVARVHAELWAGLAAGGVTIGPHDLLIGATALVAGFGVATLNEREFRRIPRLPVVNPASARVG